MFGRRRLPAGSRPPLAAGERVLGWARAAEGGTVVATNRGLHLPGYGDAWPSGDPAHPAGVAGAADGPAGAAAGTEPAAGFLGWHEIHKATWSGRQLVVTPGAVVARREGYLVVADRPPVTLTLLDPGELPHVVRTRVTRSVSFSAHHLVPGGGVQVVARRVPGQDGVSWAVRYDDGTDPDGPGVTDATDQLVRGAENR